MRRSQAWCIPVLILLCTSCLAQRDSGTPDPRNIDGSAFGQRIDLTPVWLFSPTDNPEYASPTFDVRSWTQVFPKQDFLFSYGFRDFPIGWFRVHVHLPAHASSMVISTSRIRGEYQIFANGVQIGGPAVIRQEISHMQIAPANFSIPERALSKATGELVIALRVAPSLYGVRGRGTDSPIAPTATVFLVSAEAAPRETSYVATHGVGVDIFETGLFFLAGLVALSLFSAMRSNREYLAAAVYLLATALTAACEIVGGLWVSTLLISLVESALGGVSLVGLCEFVRIILHHPRTRILIALESLCFLGTAAFLPVLFVVPVISPFTLFLPRVVVDILLPVLLVRGLRQRNPDAPLLLPILVVYLAQDFWEFLESVAFFIPGLGEIPPPPSLHLGTYTLQFTDLSAIVCLCMILLFLVLRTVRIAREGTRTATELEAAQSVQRLLLARSSEATPGFEVEAVYRPASEVGGDLFFVSPNHQDGSLLALVGDASGKGLNAAMRVSMILGVLRCETSRSPSRILANLNQALLTQTEMGFTTACCVHLDRDGSYLIANAGHISPYIEGVETATCPALPLGLAPDQAYEPLAGVLQAGERMVLLSDGIPEARSSKGELYGFDRLSALTLHSANHIADTAQSFGQDDDITVLTIALAAEALPFHSTGQFA